MCGALWPKKRLSAAIFDGPDGKSLGKFISVCCWVGLRRERGWSGRILSMLSMCVGKGWMAQGKAGPPPRPGGDDKYSAIVLQRQDNEGGVTAQTAEEVRIPTYLGGTITMGLVLGLGGWRPRGRPGGQRKRCTARDQWRRRALTLVIHSFPNQKPVLVCRLCKVVSRQQSLYIHSTPLFTLSQLKS